MHVAEFSVRNSVLVNLLMVTVVAVGLWFSFSLPLQMFPSVQLEAVTVRTVFPGSSAEDMEQLVSVPVEQEIKNVPGIKIVKSVSSEGVSVVTAELYPGEDVSAVAEEIDSKVSYIRDRLPEDAREPVVDEMRGSFPLVSVSVSGDVPPRTLRRSARRLRDELLLVDGVESVTSAGLGAPAFWAYLDRAGMRQFGLGVEQVSAAIGASNLDLPGGSVGQGDVEFLITTKGKIRSVEDLLSIPVSRDDRGRHVLLRDVATVTLGEEKPVSRSRINGRPAVTFWVTNSSNVDVVSTVEAVRRLGEKYESGPVEGLEVTLTNDMSRRVKSRLATMVKSGALGLVLVLVLLGLFLDRTAALIAALGIPVSFLGAVILMKTTGVTLNLISMFGLIVILGIIVDDSIIVVENIQRYIARGLEPARAAVVGAGEVALPVIATILTNVAAFTPLLLATGLIGQFLSIIPKVAIFALCFSLLEALVIMPSHCADWIRPGVAARRGAAERSLFRARRLYLSGLFFALRNRYVVTGCFVFVFLLSAAVFARMPNVMFYLHDTDEMAVRVETPARSTLEYTASSVARVEEAVRESFPEGLVRNVTSMVGVDLVSQDSASTGDHVATVFIEFADYSERKENALDLSREAEKRVKETVAGPKQVDFISTVGPPAGKPVSVAVSGEDIGTLMAVASEIRDYLEGIAGVSAASSNLLYGKPEARVEVDEARAGAFGLDTATLAREVRALGDGLAVAETRVGNEEANVNVAYASRPANVASLLGLHQVRAPDGRWVPLGSVARITEGRTPLEIRREDLRRTVAVTAEVDAKRTTSREVNARLSRYVDGLVEKYPDYDFRFGGQEEEYRQAMSDITRAALLAVILIYVILAAMLRSYFQPLIIMSVLPMSITGVMAGVLLRGEPMSLPAIIGTVALMGIVVNDSLILMDFINRRAKRLPGRAAAVVFSARYRFRPIVLTTLTTFAGLFSLMFVYRGEAAFLAPMAVALGFGLLFSTVIILYLVPCLYLALGDVAGFARGLSARFAPRRIIRGGS